MGKLIFTSAFFNPVEEIIQGTAPAIKSRGGLLVGNSHDEGGIPAVVEDTEPIEVEGGEAIINKKAVSKKGTKVRKGTNKKILSDINEETGGVPIMKKGGKIKSQYRIFEGVDHLKNKPIYRVESISENENEYVGEWHKNRKDAAKELKSIGQYKKGGKAHNAKRKGKKHTAKRKKKAKTKHKTKKHGKEKTR